MNTLFENAGALLFGITFVFSVFIIIAVLFRIISKIIFRTFFEERRQHEQSDEGRSKTTAEEQNQERS